MDAQAIGIVIGAICVLLVLFALFGGEQKSKATKRADALSSGRVAQAKKVGAGGNADQTKDRRKAVSESLRKLEEKQKEISEKRKVSLPQRIEQAGYDFTVREFYMFSGIFALVAIGIGIISGQNIWVIAAMGFVGFLGVPRWFLARARKKRQKKFVDEFSNALDVIVRGVKSGLPVNECLKIIARDSQSPVKEEFALLVEGQKIGLTMEQTLDRMYLRMPISEVNFFGIVLVIQQQTGGNLAGALGNLSTVLRSRKSMYGKIAALSMEAKASAAILAAMPFMVSGMVYMAAPDYLAPLHETARGQFMLICAGVWMLIGVLVMKNMIAIKV